MFLVPGSRTGPVHSDPRGMMCVAVADACPHTCGGCSQDGSFLAGNAPAPGFAFSWPSLVSTPQFVGGTQGYPDVPEVGVSAGEVTETGTAMTILVTTCAITLPHCHL